MKVNKLNKRVAIASVGKTLNDIGGFTESYTTIATVWADVISATGRQIVEAGQAFNYEQLQFYIRYRSDVTTKHQIIYAGDYYNIKHIKTIEIDKLKDGLQITAERVSK